MPAAFSTSSEQEAAFRAARDQARRGRVQHRRCALDLGHQCRDIRHGVPRGRRGRVRPRAGLVRRRRIAMPATTSSCAARKAGGSGVGSSPASPRSASSRRPISSRRRTSRWRACAALTRSPCASSAARAASSSLRRPAQLARDQRDLGLGHHAAGAGDGFLRAEGARRPAQQGLGADEIAELRHGDAAQRQRRRIVAQARPASERRADRPPPARAPPP